MSDQPEYWAVIPSRGGEGRDVLLHNMVTQLLFDEVNVVVVDTGMSPPFSSHFHSRAYAIRDIERPKNISRWWNKGLEFVERGRTSSQCAVAVLNDDLVLPPFFVQNIAQRMWNSRATVAYPDQHNIGHDMHLTNAVPVPLTIRMTGYAFVLDATEQVRADENMVWWYGDDDIDWTCREKGGSLLVSGVRCEHVYPNSSTNDDPVLLEQTGRDRQAFLAKWGVTPW